MKLSFSNHYIRIVVEILFVSYFTTAETSHLQKLFSTKASRWEIAFPDIPSERYKLNNSSTMQTLYSNSWALKKESVHSGSFRTAKNTEKPTKRCKPFLYKLFRIICKLIFFVFSILYFFFCLWKQFNKESW